MVDLIFIMSSLKRIFAEVKVKPRAIEYHHTWLPKLFSAKSGVALADDFSDGVMKRRLERVALQDCDWAHVGLLVDSIGRIKNTHFVSLSSRPTLKPFWFFRTTAQTYILSKESGWGTRRR